MLIQVTQWKAGPCWPSKKCFACQIQWEKVEKTNRKKLSNRIDKYLNVEFGKGLSGCGLVTNINTHHNQESNII